MARSRAIVSKLDRSRLEPHLSSAAPPVPVTRLRTLLEFAATVPPEHVPPNVVTMNSRVVLRNRRDEPPEVYVLAYPDYDGRSPVYVLSPLGSALLGARVGDKIEYAGANGLRSMTLEAIDYQPERNGHYDL